MLFLTRVLSPAQSNCYVVADDHTREAAVIDPGWEDPWFAQAIAEHQLMVRQILLTHGHLDHIGGVNQVRRLTGAPVLIHAADAAMLTDPWENGSARWGLKIQCEPADGHLSEGDAIRVGAVTFRVLHTPGHSPGSVSFVMADRVVTGDALFAGSIGRTDLPGGDFDTLIRAIKTKLLVLPPELKAYPGHGPSTTIGDEREFNPFLQ